MSIYLEDKDKATNPAVYGISEKSRKVLKKKVVDVVLEQNGLFLMKLRSVIIVKAN
jgi:hypothetical protein